MGKHGKIIVTALAVLAVAVFVQLGTADIAAACGWGQSGGQDYVPQQRGARPVPGTPSALSEEQARDIVTSYAKRLNPELEVGRVTDNGGFYEVEILDSGREIVQLVGVDKRSGRLIVMN